MSESSSNSDSSSDSPVKRKKSKIRSRSKKNHVVNAENGRFKCNYCDARFEKKSFVYKHIQSCTKREPDVLKCQWCNLEFVHKGNLATHAKNLHGDNRQKFSFSHKKNKFNLNMNIEESNNNVKDSESGLDSKCCDESMKPPLTTKVLKSYKSVTNFKDLHDFKCHVCERLFPLKKSLFYHLRRVHFNLQAKIPYAELKKVNQVWFEKVLNTEIVVEIKKTGRNTLVIRKLDENTNIKVTDTNTKIIDLSSLYPVNKKIEPRVYCDICKRSYVKKDYKKHVQEIHMKSVKHHCNNCNRSFKRSYQYVQHVCHKARKVKGVTHAQRNNSEIRIASVESLSISLGS